MPATKPALPSPAKCRSGQRAIVTWFARHQRTLPWRTDRSPYRVWVAEIMAQQTRIATVTPYFERFLRRFPDVVALANAPLDDVLARWSGLGYYRRAHHLHQTARAIVNQYGGEWPRDPDTLRKLPGIGRYTAGAIASIAFNQPAPVLDGNVMRVLTRLYNLTGNINETATRNFLWKLAAALAPHNEPRTFNEGIMELGALVCTPRSPACPRCPLRRMCLARRAGVAEKRPVKKSKRTPLTVRLLVAVVRNENGAVLLARHDGCGLYPGLWGLPHCGPNPDRSDAGVVAAALRKQFGAPVRKVRKRGSLTHLLTHRRLEIDIFECAWPAPRSPNGEVRWLDDDEDVSALGLSSLTRRILKMVSAFRVA
jgi:A/G-specific adenine glycosylase